MLTKGVTTSELWVVLILIAAQFFEITGSDMSIVIDGVVSAQDQVAELAKQLKEQAGTGNVTSTWVAMAYVVGRALLKWREIGK